MESKEEFKKRCGFGDPKKCDLVTQYLGVPFVPPLTRLYLFLGFKRGESVLVSWILVGSLAGILYGFGNYWWGLVALFLYHLSWILDGVDGSVARYNNKTSIRSTYLDLIGHSIVKIFILLGMGIGAYVHPPSYISIPPEFYLFAGGLCATFMTANNLARLKSYETFADTNLLEEMLEKKRKFKPRKDKGFSWKIFTLEHLGINPLGLFYFATIFNLIPVMILGYSLLLPLMFFLRAYNEYSYIRVNIDEKTNEIEKNEPEVTKSQIPQ